MKVLLAGSHGMIGSALMRRLEARGDQVTRMVRTRPGPGEIQWDLEQAALDMPGLEGFDAIIHLAGVGIGERRLTYRQKQRVWDSRVVSTEILAKAMNALEAPPKTFLCGSAVGYYGSRGDEVLTESSDNGEGFLATLCKQWEEASQVATDAGVRVVNTRSGVVFSKTGGSLDRQLPLFKLCLGGRMGSGDQWLSWITLHDEVEALVHVLDTDSLSGPVNVTSPEPTTNGVFTYTLALLLNRPALIPAPRWMIALALGADLTDELILTSQRAVPEKLLESGFGFQHPDVRAALEAVLAEDTSKPKEAEQEGEAT